MRILHLLYLLLFIDSSLAQGINLISIDWLRHFRVILLHTGLFKDTLNYYSIISFRNFVY